MRYSILTVTFNRCRTVYRLWESLNRMKDCDSIEWVIVDNASNDGTHRLIKKWTSQSRFKIVYHRLPFNQGLAAGLNAGQKLVTGDYTIVVDDDDFLFDNAIETVDKYIHSFRLDAKPDIAGVAFRSIDEYGKLIGSAMPQYKMITNRLDLEHIYKIGSSAEIVTVAKNSARSKYKYIELLPPDLAPNSITLNRMARSYALLYIDEPIRIMYRHDGMHRLTSRTKYAVKFPLGNYMKSLSVLNSEIDYFWHAPKYFVHHARKLRRYGLHNGKNVYTQSVDLSNAVAKLLWIVFGIIPGTIGYMKDRYLARINQQTTR